MKQIIKNYLILSIYLLIFVFLPFVVVNLFEDNKHTTDWVGYLALYVIFISPFLFIIPYKMSKFMSKKEKIYFIVFGLIIPFLLIYYYIYLDFLKNFHPGF